LIVLAMTALAGCASGLDKNQCLSADWNTIGFEDGLRGASADRIGWHREACARHQVTPDLTAYLRGRDRGLQQYCHAGNGFRVGLNGSGYSGACTGKTETAFLEGHRQGRAIHDARTELRKADAQLRSAHNGLTSTDNALSSATVEVAAPKTPTDRRTFLATEIVRLTQERMTWVTRIDELTLRRQQLAEQLSVLERQSPYPL
jgi:hypothetical protein